MFGGAEMSRSTLYRRLGATERAGIPIRTSLATVVAQGGEGRAFAPVLAGVEAGQDLGEAAGRAPDLESIERSLLRAGSRAGRLPEAFERLGDLFQQRASARRKLIAAMAYPVFLLHMAAILPNAGVLVSEGLAAFLTVSLVPLVAAWGAILCGVFLWRALRAANPDGADGLIIRMPVVGRLAHRSSLALSLGVMRALVESGVSVMEAVDAAHEACPNRRVARFFRDIRLALDQGKPIDEAFAGAALLHDVPPTTIDLVSTGAKTGQLDTMLARAAALLDEEASTTRTVLLVGMGGLAFALAAGLVAWKVISFYMDLMAKSRSF